MLYDVKTIQGTEKIKVYNVNDFPFHRLETSTTRRRGVNVEYLNKPMTMDIETSKHEDIVYMYMWQVCVQGMVVVGRKWKEYIQFLNLLSIKLDLDENRKQIIYVHNLSYEFKFITNFIDVDEVFATDINKVLTVKSGCYEYRCSYFLSGKSLEKFLEDAKTPHYLKTSNDIDHNIKRTPKTILTNDEMGYCIIDVLGLYYRILELLEDDNINTIPLTKTGYVRRDVVKNMLKNRKNKHVFEDTRLSDYEYDLLKETFRGGNTASSRYHCNRVIHDNVKSYDIASSYPFQMLTEYFPIGKFRAVKIKNLKRLKQYNDIYCTVARYGFTNIRIKTGVPIPYIPTSKCFKVYDPIAFNGRILSSDALIIALTDVDFSIIENQYEWDELKVYDFMYSTRGRLPSELIETMMTYYRLKSTLKGVEGMEYEYLCNKELLNSMYGMIVQNCKNEIITYRDNEFQLMGEWTSLDDFYKSYKKVLPYQWGIWITAHARKQLQTAIDIVGLDCVYVDTDSVKFIDNGYTPLFNSLNERINKRCIDSDISNFIENNGSKTSYMGLWELDGEYKAFKTLGAKKYAYVDIDNKLKITVAGLNKKKGALELAEKGGIEYFNEYEVFYNSGRTSAKYVNMDVKNITVDEVEIETGSYILIEDVYYTLGISNQMQAIIDNIK